MLGSTLRHFIEHPPCVLVADVLAVFSDLFGVGLVDAVSALTACGGVWS
jgi:hypothetical protein